MSGLLAGVGALANIISGFGASRARRAEEEKRRALLAEMGAMNDQSYRDLQMGNSLSLRRATGLLGDSLRSNSRSMGAGLAEAGITNSSATAGAIEQNAAANAALLAQMAGQAYQSERSLQNANKRESIGRQLGYADQNVSNARGSEANAYGGLAGNIAELVSAYSPRTRGYAMNGNQNSTLPTIGQKAFKPLGAGLSAMRAIGGRF